MCLPFYSCVPSIHTSPPLLLQCTLLKEISLLLLLSEYNIIPPSQPHSKKLFITYTLNRSKVTFREAKKQALQGTCWCMLELALN